MTLPFIEVLRPGALTTVQDLGRTGHQRYGVSVGGAMDLFAASVANILADNKPNSPLLEITFLGPQLKFYEDSLIAITGADLSAVLANGKTIPSWSSLFVAAGDVLTFGPRRSGARAYLAVKGGIHVPTILGSSSTDLRGQFGGLNGNALKAGNHLNINPSDHTRSIGVRSIVEADLLTYRPNHSSIGVVRYYGRSHPDDSVWENFLANEYAIRPDSDRMGIRLEGPRIGPATAKVADTYSEPVALGTIQVPPNGLPIVLMADRQTVGGYPKIGTVITVDIGRLAQMAPGDAVRFSEITLDEAQSLLIAEKNYLVELSAANS
jgi:antagonist of KipI